MSALVPAPEADRECGLLAYSTPGERVAGRLRAHLDDFRVEEILSTFEISQSKEPGLVPVYKVRKAGIDTPHVAREMAAQIRSEVNFAGLKDKNATAIQYMSARSTRASAPSEVMGAKFQATLLGFSRPITRGMLLGNRFTILLLTALQIDAQIDQLFEASRRGSIANFFGYQRFGLRGGVNRRVGKALISADFSLATRLVLAEPRRGEDERVKEARRLCLDGRFREAIPLFSANQDLERKIANHLAERPGDDLGALRRMPIQIRRLLVNAYQAYLFNLTLSRVIAEEVDISKPILGDNWARLGEDGLSFGKVHGAREAPEGGATVPLVQIVGYAYRNYGSRFDERLAGVLREEEVEPRAFYVKNAEEISSEGGFRPAPLISRDLSFRRSERGYSLEFSLAKGEYATILLREVLKPESPETAGF